MRTTALFALAAGASAVPAALAWGAAGERLSSFQTLNALCSWSTAKPFPFAACFALAP